MVVGDDDDGEEEGSGVNNTVTDKPQYVKKII